MTQIFSGSGLGLSGSATHPLNSSVLNKSAGLGQGGASVYVNGSNGNLVIRQQDAFMAGESFGFDVFETYNSLKKNNSWQFNVCTHLNFISSLEIHRTGEDGHIVKYLYDNKVGKYMAEDGSTSSIVKKGDFFEYHDGYSKKINCYNAEGRLEKITDLDGHVIFFEYDKDVLVAMHDTSGSESVQWIFENGYLKDIIVQSKHEKVQYLHYEYDAIGRLSLVSRELGDGSIYRTAYSYAGDSNLISGIEQSDGTVIHFAYDDLGRIARVTDGEGRSTIYQYFEGKTHITEGNEHWTYSYNTKNLLTRIEGPEQYHLDCVYDEKGRLIKLSEGSVLSYFSYNEYGDCIRTESITGEVVLYDYDANHHVISETRFESIDDQNAPSLPKTKRFVYDDVGHLRFTVSFSGTVTEYRYDSSGQLMTERTYLNQSTGKLLPEQSLELDELQVFASQYPSDISLTEYHYDWRGLLSESIRYLNVDEYGNGILDKNILIEYSRYDASGRLIETARPFEGKISTTHFLYDALGRLLKMTDNEGHEESIEYQNGAGCIIKTAANGLRTIEFYDKSGSKLSTHTMKEGTDFGTVYYFYDDAGRLTRECREDGQNTYFIYDGLGRLQAKIASGGEISVYRYDEDGHCVYTCQYENKVDVSLLSQHNLSLESLNLSTSETDRVSRFIYEKGQLRFQINSEGAITGYSYDAEGRIKEKIAYATLFTGHIDDLQSSADDRCVTYYYDTSGQVCGEINAEGSVTSYRYDRQGHLVEKHIYYKKAVTPLTGEWSNDLPIQSSEDLVSLTFYNAQGLKVAELDAAGYLKEFFYNEEGLLSDSIAYYTRYTGKITESLLPAQLKPAAHRNDHRTHFRYDDLGRLVEERTQSGLVTKFAYNESGQLIELLKSDAKGDMQRGKLNRYDDLGRIAQTLDEIGFSLLRPDMSIEEKEAIWEKHSTSFTYDNCGRLLTQINALKESQRFIYDEQGFLRFIIGSDGAITEHKYNHFFEIESTVRYQAFWPSNLQSNYKELLTFTQSIADSRFDEMRFFTYNHQGQLLTDTNGGIETWLGIYNAFGELVKTQSPGSLNQKMITTYEYDKLGHVTERIADAGGSNNTWKGVYDVFGRLDTEWDARNNWISNGYNKRGELISIYSVSGFYKFMQYDALGKTLELTDSRHHEYFEYDDEKNTVQLRFEFDPDSPSITTSFNVFGEKVSFTDGNGHMTSYFYNERGLLERVEGPEHSKTDYGYDDKGQLLFQKNANGVQECFFYDAAGRILRKIVDPDGLALESTYTYDALGRTLLMSEGGIVTSLTYDKHGNLIQKCTDPEGLNISVDFLYDDRGLLIRQTLKNPQGVDKMTSYEWDNFGRCLKETHDPDGLKITTSFAYDANGNCIRETDPNGNTKHFIFDSENRLRFSVDAMGVVSEQVFSRGGSMLRKIVYAHPLVFHEAYSETLLKSTLIKDVKADHTQYFTYDAKGRMEFSFDSLGYPTRYFYDNNDNLISKMVYASPCSLEDLQKRGFAIPVASKADRKISFVYDGLNRQCFQIDEKKRVTEFIYNATGQLISKISYSTPLNIQTTNMLDMESIRRLIKHQDTDRVFLYDYNPAGQLVLECSPEGTLRSFEYDKAGHIISSIVYATRYSGERLPAINELPVSSEDKVSRFFFDGAGREYLRISPGGKTIERTFDDSGNVLTEKNHDRITVFKYDAEGRLIIKKDAQDQLVLFTYDSNGNLIEKTDTGHQIWTYCFDKNNRLIESRTPMIQMTVLKSGIFSEEIRSVITQNIYDNFGNLITSIKDAGGIYQTVHSEYDLNNHLICRKFPEVAINSASAQCSSLRQEEIVLLTETYAYDAFGQIIRQKDKKGHEQHFAYDKTGKLMYSLGTDGALTAYEYDSFDNLIKTSKLAKPAQLSDGMSFTTDNLEDGCIYSTKDRHEYFRWDKESRLIESRKDEVRTYNSLTQTYTQSAPCTRYFYNTFGELIRESVAVSADEWSDTRNEYDLDGQKISVLSPGLHLSTYNYNVYGELVLETQYENSSDVDFHIPLKSDKDRAFSYSYDDLGQLLSKTLHNQTVQHFNGSQYGTVKKDLSTFYSYDALGNLVSTTDALGATTFSYFNATGQLIATAGVMQTAGRSLTTYHYNALGELIETRCYAHGATYADEKNFIAGVLSENDIVSSNLYDLQGHLIAQTNGTGHTVNYSYDANGNLARSWYTLSQHGENIAVDKRYTYDKANRLTCIESFKSSQGVVKEDTQYNTFGEIIATGINGIFTRHNDYDVLGRVWRSNSNGYYQIFVYDLMNRVSQVVTAASAFIPEWGNHGADLSQAYYDAVLSFISDRSAYDLYRQDNVYDASGFLIRQTKDIARSGLELDKKNAPERVSQTYTHDRWGNILSHTNAKGLTTYYEYNAFDAVVWQKMPEVEVVDESGRSAYISPVVYQAYDELGRSVALTDANGHTICKVLDANGRTIEERDALGFHRRKSYNLLDDMVNSENERGFVTTYAYDKEHRLISLQGAKGQTIYQYDGAGHLLLQKDSETQMFWYDNLGRQVKQYKNSSGLHRYEYDDAGHKIRDQDANGHVSTWHYDEQNRLESHTDLGGHINHYVYNNNGLLIEETSTAGKNSVYHYLSDGSLEQYDDRARHELMNYRYDALGNIIYKESSELEGWMVETDYYEYDALGRLSKIRRRKPGEMKPDMPEKKDALLSIDYEYDAVGNIRDVNVDTNYTNFEHLIHRDYFKYDANNRMLINKGLLENSSIVMGKKGSVLSYDAAGNVIQALTNESGIQQYNYQYNAANQVQSIKKNNIDLEKKIYNGQGELTQEFIFNAKGLMTEIHQMTYENGLLKTQKVMNRTGENLSKNLYDYDATGHITNLTSQVSIRSGSQNDFIEKHHYEYDLWEAYQQKTDEMTLDLMGRGTTSGTSTYLYDVNGLLSEMRDQNNKQTRYLTSQIDGIRARKDENGQTAYFNVAGKTLGDIRIDNRSNQKLDVYGGFTPKGQGEASVKTGLSHWESMQKTQNASAFFKNDQDFDFAEDSFVRPNSPEDHIGSYTLKPGDTLESVALQAYGDSSLWYLLADANGITDRHARAGETGSQLHAGQRLTIPSTSASHMNSETEVILDGNPYDFISAGPKAVQNIPSIGRGRKKVWQKMGKIALAVISVVATVMSAGALGLIQAGGLASLAGAGVKGLILMGNQVLSSSLTLSFTAGIIGNLAAQGAANAFRLQKGIDLTGALLSGLATATTAGVNRFINSSSMANKMNSFLENNSLKSFNANTAVQAGERDVFTQSMGFIRPHQKFSWEELGTSMVTGGLLGSQTSAKVHQVIDNTFKEAKTLVSSEIQALVSETTRFALQGGRINVGQVLVDNLGGAVGESYLNETSTAKKNTPVNKTSLVKTSKQNKASEIETSNLFDLLIMKKTEARPFSFHEWIESKASSSTTVLKKTKPANKKKYKFNKECDIKIWNALNEKFETKIMFDKISKAEGDQTLIGYVPNNNGKVIGQSGVTIATGYDIGQHDKQEIKNLGLSKETTDKLLPFVLLKKQDAWAVHKQAENTKITKEEADLIDFKSNEITVSSAIMNWNKRKKDGTPKFNDLTTEQQTVIISRTFHQGVDMPNKPISQKFYQAALSNNWLDAEYHLRHYNTADKSYITRVTLESNILKKGCAK